MSLITGCPACGTMFRVVPDQLKISEGWVRCGHCTEVFDATAHMVDEAALEQARRSQSMFADMETVPAFLASRQPEEEAALPEPEPLPPVPPAIAEREPVRTAPPSRTPPPPEPDDSSLLGADSHILEPSPLDTPFVFRTSDLVDGGDLSVLPPAPRASQLEEEEHHDPTPSELEAVSFVRQARRRAFWRRPLVRVLLVFASFALAALLVLQLAYRDRDRLALAEPALRPALQQLCELLGCRLGAPRQIESIVIESSGFNRVRSDTYRLAFTLRNTARVQVAVPAMELTVTDAQDQPIARRVLLPAEIGAAGEALAPAAELSRAIGISVDPPAAARVAGYRLLAFYP